MYTFLRDECQLRVDVMEGILFNTVLNSTRRTFCKHLSAAAATTFFLGANTLSAHADSDRDAKFRHSLGAGINVLLVHGAWVDASSWIGVIPLLQTQGYHVLAVQNPLSSLEDDMHVTRQALASLSGPTILVGHSYGGAVITNVGTGASNLHSLVYIAAVAPEEGESVMGISNQFPTTPIAAHVVPSYRQGYNWVDPAFFPPDFVQDIPVAKARALAVVQKPITPECFMAKSGPPAWKTVPSWYLVSGNDRVINVDSERFMAKRIGATTRQIASSHASPVSHPQAVFEIIVAASQGAPAVRQGTHAGLH
jgi:pimeloyl-ACP methyl ester carboxylesterase